MTLEKFKEVVRETKIHTAVICPKCGCDMATFDLFRNEDYNDYALINFHTNEYAQDYRTDEEIIAYNCKYCNSVHLANSCKEIEYSNMTDYARDNMKTIEATDVIIKERYYPQIVVKQKD